jgi:metal-dependent amidase/aminoacylase/carboxypeptidase family protein
MSTDPSWRCANGNQTAISHQSRDPFVITSGQVGSFQTVPSRNVAPPDTHVLSVVQLHAGSGCKLVLDRATLLGTIRDFRGEVCELAESRMGEFWTRFAKAFGVEIHIVLRNIVDVLVNDPDFSDAYTEAAADIVARENISGADRPATRSEDFADILKIIPVGYCRVGHSCTTGLYNPSVFLGSKLYQWARLLWRGLLHAVWPLERTQP